ncbi:helix-turn-helix domain-containing protein [Actinomadura rudentiformis]|uniref:Helix-turn-helix domain-containing protein n=1 Tax=Actinomadura rudentiformis TaxID=359158 RepID=A0A6H9YZQ8_9ACTN|nr:helix-turn-helix transcriptional regulator [Actinomadura rudentiformis]KAB2347503.1 helix-turn-helix domain-containing protein [Actinomadura rudentiformis]
MLEPEELGRRKSDLAATLKALRKEAGLTGQSLALKCAMSQSKVSKIETGKLLPTVVDVERILHAVEAPAELMAEVMALTRLANTEYQDVRSLLRKGLEKKQHELAGLEAGSSDLRFFLPTMITSLLSTPEYIRASLAHSPGDISKAVARKLDRQAILYDETKRFTFVLTEAAIRWPLCPPSQMAMQVDRLSSLSHLPNVRIGVLPLEGHLPRGPLNTFTVYDSRLVTAETFGGAIIMRDPKDVAYHRQLFSLFEGFASFDDDARSLLVNWARSFRA